MSNRSDTFLLDPGTQFSAALDPHRRAAYRRALEQAFDSRGGTPSVALLGWQAATLIDVVANRAGRVVIVEEDAELCDDIHAGIVARGLGTNVEMVQHDPATVSLDSRVDIVVAGLASTWFMEGPAAAILSNAQAHVLVTGGIMVPRRFVHLFELACSTTDINGISLRVPRYTRPTEPVPALSESKHWSTTDMGSAMSSGVEDTIIVYPLLSGTLTGIRLTTLAEFSDSNVHPAAHSGFQSIFAPLRESVDVSAGQPVEIFVRYQMGGGLQKTQFSARTLQQRSADGWEHADHPQVAAFRQKIAKMVAMLDEQGRGGDLDKVVSYTIDPHGDVSRLAALSWTVDEEFRKPLRDLVEEFRTMAAKLGSTPSDETIYELMLSTYREVRGE
jgi:hypothetical protein